MNKLEEYKVKESEKLNREGYIGQHIWEPKGYRTGFDAAIALNLPVRFANYVNLPDSSDVEAWLLHFGYMPSLQEKYQYWIDYVYSPE